MRKPLSYTYSEELPNGSTLRVNATLPNDYQPINRKTFESLPDNAELEVLARKDAIDSVISSPIGGLEMMKETDRREFIMTKKQFSDLIEKFNTQGSDYYDFI